MSEKKQPENRSKVKLDSRVPRDLKERVLRWQQENQLKEFSQAVVKVLERGLSNDPDALNLQLCNYRSEIPAYYQKFVRCIRDHKTITEEQCKACYLYQIIKEPLISLEKAKELQSNLKQDIQNLRKEKQRLTVEVEELDANTEAGLREEIHKLNKNWKLTQGVLREKTEDSMPQKFEQSPQILKRTVEEKKTTEEYLPSPQVKAAPSDLLLCPDSKEFVDVEKTCKKTCEIFMDCVIYQKAVVEKVFQK